jgi:hypothetical protein
VLKTTNEQLSAFMLIPPQAQRCITMRKTCETKGALRVNSKTTRMYTRVELLRGRSWRLCQADDVDRRRLRLSAERHCVNLCQLSCLYAATYGGLSEYWANLNGGNFATNYTIVFCGNPSVTH